MSFGKTLPLLLRKGNTHKIHGNKYTFTAFVLTSDTLVDCGIVVSSSHKFRVTSECLHLPYDGA